MDKSRQIKIHIGTQSYSLDEDELNEILECMEYLDDLPTDPEEAVHETLRRAFRAYKAYLDNEKRPREDQE